MNPHKQKFLAEIELLAEDQYEKKNFDLEVPEDCQEEICALAALAAPEKEKDEIFEVIDPAKLVNMVAYYSLADLYDTEENCIELEINLLNYLKEALKKSFLSSANQEYEFNINTYHHK